jgi:hypothetical protein
MEHEKDNEFTRSNHDIENAMATYARESMKRLIRAAQSQNDLQKLENSLLFLSDLDNF